MEKKHICWILIVVSCLVLVLIGSIVCSMARKSQLKDELFIAISKKDANTVEAIIQRFPSLVNETRRGTIFWEAMIGITNPTPLLTAIQDGNKEIVALLLAYGADANKGNYCYPLIEAIRRGHNEIAWLLIEYGADVSIVDHTSWRQTVPYQIVSIKISEGDMEHAEEQFELLKYVIEHGASLTPPVGRPKGINTLLGVAASQNHAPIVEYLIEQKLYGIDDRVTDDGKTALICAVEERAYDACEALLKCKANKALQDVHGKTALDYAQELEDEKLIAMLIE